MRSKKFALIHMGTDVIYSLEYVAAEILKHGHEIKWFDGDLKDGADIIASYEPDYLCFSPLTTFFKTAVELTRHVKETAPNIRSIFGGCHVSALPEVIELAEIDIVVIGPVYGTIDPIVNSKKSEVIKGHLVPPEQMMPASRGYFASIARIGNRHRKALMSHFGCVHNCSYCLTSRMKKALGYKDYKKYCLTRRPIKNLIEEAKIFLEFQTKEVALGDDDILYGENIDEWLQEFSAAWKKEINLPIYGFVSPATVVRVSDKTLKILAGLVDTVAMGVQASRYESLKLFNRHWQTEEMVKQALDRLKSFNIPAKLEGIIGLPVEDPIDDAIETIKLLQRVGAGTFAAIFPLMLYPGTALYNWCKENNIPIDEDCDFEWYSGRGSIKFDSETTNKIFNLSKLGTFFVKYNINKHWIRSLIEMDFTSVASREVSKCNYKESLLFRQGENASEEIDKILSETKIRY